VTVAVLIALNRPDQLRSHLARARDNGVTREELIKIIAHLPVYANWPNALTAGRISTSEDEWYYQGTRQQLFVNLRIMTGDAGRAVKDACLI
jgi:hypothetical protein